MVISPCSCTCNNLSLSLSPSPIHPHGRQEGHIPATCSYKLSEIFTDLVNFAVKYLVVGGRLVYWVPIILNE